MSKTKVVDPPSGLAMAIGTGLGLLVSRVPHSGLEWTARNKPFRLSDGEALAQLKPYWDRFPRFYAWVVAIPYFVILALRARIQVPAIVEYPIGHLVGRVILSMSSGASLLQAVFYAYAYLEMGKRLSNSGNLH